MPKTFEPIATSTLNNTSATHTFDNIPSNYSDLIVIHEGRAIANSTWIRLNNDANANYSSTSISGSGASATGRSTKGAGAPNDRRLELGTASVNTGNRTVTIFQINDYNNTSWFKTVLCRSGCIGRYVIFGAGTWHSTSSITRIDIGNDNSNNWLDNSVCTLYGIKKA